MVINSPLIHLPENTINSRSKRFFYDFTISDHSDFMSRLLNWANSNFETITFLNSNQSENDPYSSYNKILAAGIKTEIIVDHQNQQPFEMLKNFSDQNQDWIFGFMTYELNNKNIQQSWGYELQKTDHIQMPLMHFYIPEILFFVDKSSISMGFANNGTTKTQAEDILRTIETFRVCDTSVPLSPPRIKQRVSREDYLKNAKNIQKHILRGDIYEMNYCIEFFSHDKINPLRTYLELTQKNPSPFSCFYKKRAHFVMSSSPERFLAKRNNKLISQPIKGTIKRGATKVKDTQLKQQLLNDPKERSENIMIVDLVRNDLSRSAEKGSVKVEELCGIYTYPHVHQMISTISCNLHPRCHFADAIKKAFPMGSMTGAPKIRAMEIIHDYEITKRGLYSGAVGYITPGKDFDFNVVIRSILYNAVNKYVSFMAGSALTVASDPEKEYEECLLKASAMASVLGSQW
ncbi:MAG: anthranilate synthase component I family protein [Bacteroidota bacterium]